MNKRLMIFSVLTVILLLIFGGSNSSTGLLDVQFVSTGADKASMVNLEEIKPLVIALLAGRLEDRLPFIQYQLVNCTKAEGSGNPNSCRAGEIESTPVKAFPIGNSKGDYVRPDAMGPLLDQNLKDLFAVYRISPNPKQAPPWPTGEIGLLFDREQFGNPASLTAVVKDGWLVRLDFHPGETTEQVLKNIPVSQVVLPPRLAKDWSEPLRRMLVRTILFPSTNLRWTAYRMTAAPANGTDTYYQRMVVTNPDQVIAWKAVDEWVRFGTENFYPQPLAWSKDDLTLYWTMNTVPESDCLVSANGSDLHKLDLITGDSIQLLGPVGNWLALSPDGNQLAAAGPEGLVVYDLKSGEKRGVPLDDGAPGWITWSPDGGALVLTIAQNNCDIQGSGTSSVLRVDVENMESKKLIDHDPRAFKTLNWSSLGPVSLVDKDGIAWQMDPEIGMVGKELLVSAPSEVKTFVNNAHGYSLVYPAEYLIEQPIPEETILFLGSLLNTPQPRASIWVSNANGHKLEQAVNEFVAGFPDFEIPRSNLLLGGEQAIRLDKVPGQDFQRVIFVMKNDQLYQLSFSPDMSETPGVQDKLEQLFETVKNFFKFIDAPAAASTLAGTPTSTAEPLSREDSVTKTDAAAGEKPIP